MNPGATTLVIGLDFGSDGVRAVRSSLDTMEAMSSAVRGLFADGSRNPFRHSGRTPDAPRFVGGLHSSARFRAKILHVRRVGPRIGAATRYQALGAFAQEQARS
jgi:hypothetical protein